MPRRPDVHKVLIIGSGPIVIGQACEFDYSGTQACKALRQLGYEIVLVNSNPATIMTDPVMADETYIEPLNLQTLTEIIAASKPDALLPNLGGQSGLNLSSELHRAGVLAEHGVRIIGVGPDAIERGEDRLAFKETMTSLGIDMPRSEICYSVDEAAIVAAELGYPVVIRPAYTMGGTGGGIVYNREELQIIVERGIRASLVGQVLVEESVLGWEELELEVVRDAKNQMITVCFIENVDAMGVHTGDSFCTAPMLTIAPALQERLQNYSYAIVEAIEVIGGTNIQFAHDPRTGRVVVIEINPRTSRSSALASKATGFPIAFVSSLLAGGLTMDEIPYWRDGTLEKYTPSGDYVVVKFARWAFEKFRGAEDRLGTQMRAVGEVMSIGKNYKEALQKAIRSLETGRHGLGFAKDFNARSARRPSGRALRGQQRAALHHVRSAAQGRHDRGRLQSHQGQALVRRQDAGAGGTRGVDPPLPAPSGTRRARRAAARGRRTAPSPASRSRVRPPTPSSPTTCSRRPRRTASPMPIWPSCSACPRSASESSARRWAWSTATSPCL